NPTKSTIYPEYLPRYAVRTPGVRLVHEVADALKREGDVLLVDGVGIAEAKKPEDIFRKIDVHATLRISSIVYADMLRQMAAADDEGIPNLPPQTWSRTPTGLGSGLQYLSKIWPVPDAGWSISNGTSPLAPDPAGVWIENVGDGALPDQPGLPVFDWIFEKSRP